MTALDLARHFARGATLWCASPRWPEHARHVAVEFVHPVVVGKRALPAISVESPDLVAALGAQVRTGDALLVLSTGDDAIALELMRRAKARGVMSIWMSVGAPVDDVADHVIDASSSWSAAAAFDGSLLLRYHLLWELAHVCFEHPGLLTVTEPASLP